MQRRNDVFWFLELLPLEEKKTLSLHSDHRFLPPSLTAANLMAAPGGKTIPFLPPPPPPARFALAEALDNMAEFGF